MDNVCHTLVGAAFAEAGLKRRTRYAHAVAIIGANLPDLDVLVFATDLPSVAFRRGWTHGLLAQATLPLALTLVALMVSRLRGSRDSGPPADVRLLLILSYLGVGSHVFLDFLNNYGIRLLAPFEWRWFYGDAVFIIDPWLWLALGTGVWLTRRRGSAGPAWGALAFAACYTLLMLMSARAARDVVADTWRQARGGELHALMVGPMPITPLHRAVIVDAGDRYETGTFDWVRGAVTFDPTPVAKNANRREVAIAREAPNVRAFLVWSRFPFWELRATAEGTLVTVRDMRFTGRAGGGFAASTVVPARDH